MAEILAASGSEKTKVILKSSRSPNARNWVFTLNNYTKEQIDKLYKDLAAKSKSFIFGEEIGESGTPHLQGQVCFKACTRAIENYREYGAHWEVQKGKLKEATDYCKKDGNYWQYPIPKVLKSIIKELRPWQAELAYKILYEPIDDREVIWIVDEKGKQGKSAFCKYMHWYYNAIVITVTKSADIAMCADEERDIYLLDFCREDGNRVTKGEFSPWQAIENLKNGFIQDAKLKKNVRTVCMDPPIIVCFSNHWPDVSKLSADRWNIVNLCPNQDQPT